MTSTYRGWYIIFDIVVNDADAAASVRMIA